MQLHPFGIALALTTLFQAVCAVVLMLAARKALRAKSPAAATWFVVGAALDLALVALCCVRSEAGTPMEWAGESSSVLDVVAVVVPLLRGAVLMCFVAGVRGLGAA